MVRCLALADALRRTGWRCAMATRSPAGASFADPAANCFDVLDLSRTDEEEEPRVIASRWPEGVDLLVVDHYRRDQVFEGRLRGWATTILALDDVPERIHDCDLLLDAGAAETDSYYRPFVPSSCRRLLGPAFALLRQQFVIARAAALQRRQRTATVQRVLVAFGLADSERLTATALEAVAAAGLSGLTVDVVLAGTQKHAPTIAKETLNIQTHNDVVDMAAIMKTADIAIGSAGSASWERACLGLPSIALITADNQRRNAALLMETGAALVVDGVAHDLTRRLTEGARALCTDSERRWAMTQAAAGLCDGCGTLRVILAAINPWPARDGRPIRLRVAEQGDRNRLFKRRSDERIRRFARNPDAPRRSEHDAWFDGVLADAERIMTIIEHDGEAVGVLRFDPVSDPAGGPGCEVSISVDPDRHGLGIASGALALGRRLLPGIRLYAEVLPGNVASRRLFLSAGYLETRRGHFFSPPIVSEAVE